ncbi:MAG: SURF1 family protein [Actinomycetota bacterium]|nr:SURF1 family protein [Actinomycetota bacterium]
MFRAILTRRMLGGFAIAVVFAVVCVLLGRWQWGRYEDRQVRATAVTSHYTAAPVPLADVLGRLPLTEADEWLRVTTTGRYAPAQLLVRNRSLDGSGGLEVLVPLELGGGSGGTGGTGSRSGGALSGKRLLVDRGWVANPDAAADLPSVPAAPNGEVTVQGWLRPGEPDLGKDLPAGQLASIDLGQAATQTGGSLLDAYLVLDTEQSAAGVPPRPAPLEQPDTDLGPHQAYAFQWWLTSVFGFVFLGYRIRLAVADAAVPVTPAEGEPVPSRVKKVRIWDEEDA